jgi:DNA invertase Pin-like site-specific DNA recombinase
MKKYVAYYRVSTKKQGESKLSLEWQQSEVKRYVQRTNGVLLAEYTEVETGTRKRKRIEIYKAIAQCKQEGATLIVAKLDRLSRDAEFTFNLMNSDVKFICLDLPEANETTIGIMASIAQGEAKRISERIRNAFQRKREKEGRTKIGNIDNIKGRYNKGAKISAQVRSELARVKNQVAVQLICDYRNDANYTFNKIADKLNALAIKNPDSNDYRTTRGNQFTTKQVQLLYDRYC